MTKVLKVTKIILLAALGLFLYELAGVLYSYAGHPKVSEETKKNFHPRDCYGETEGNEERAAVIEKNGDALLKRVRLIHQAEREIILSTFAFHSDDSGKIMIGALLDAAERGVSVRILADGMESTTAMEGNPYFYAMSSHPNIEIRLYNKFNFFTPWKVMGRMHDKYVIVDSKVYILGGRNSYNYFLGDFKGHKNYDRDVLVYCENPAKENSIEQLKNYFASVWEHKACSLFHDKESLGERKRVKKAVTDVQKCYNDYVAEHEKEICDTDYVKDTVAVENIRLLSNPVHTGSKEPVLWYQMEELMKTATDRVRIHTPYIICNRMMYDSLGRIAKNVPDFRVMTNSVTNNGNPFGAADYYRNRNKILNTGMDIWEYEGGYSYHGKSILIDDDLSVIGSFNMDMRSVYLDTELMLVIKSDEINRQMEKHMDEYETVSRQVYDDGSYYNPHEVKPVPLTLQRKIRLILVTVVLGWARFLF